MSRSGGSLRRIVTNMETRSGGEVTKYRLTETVIVGVLPPGNQPLSSHHVHGHGTLSASLTVAALLRITAFIKVKN
jgi:hypothetical protein